MAAEPDLLHHELANVLHGLAGMTRLLKTSNGDVDRKQWCEAIEQAARQACLLLDERSEPTEPEIRRIDGQSLLEAVVSAHTPAAAAKGLRISLVTAAGLGRHWHSDAGILRQVLDNLLANAVKFSEKGNVALIARPGPAGRLFLHVVDEGPGVSPVDRQEIFLSGRRGHDTHGLPGSGLGLALCRRNVSMLGGRIRYSVLPTGGSCFSVLLPAALQESDRFSCFPTAMAAVCYRLELGSPLRSFLRCMLNSLGIAECTRDHDSRLDSESILAVTVSETPGPHGFAGPDLVLRADSANTEPVQLAPPLLPSRVRRGLLQLALAWRWSGISRDAGKG